ncbi:MAG: hypothetical protein ABI724_18200 [Betaproteobacteria bacterium]
MRILLGSLFALCGFIANAAPLASISNSAGNSVPVLQTGTHTVIQTIQVGPRPVAFGQFIGPTAVAPVLVGGVLRKTHGSAGTFDLPLSLASSDPTTEPRAGPPHTLVFVFDNAVTGGIAVVTEGIATAGVPTFGGTEMRVPLTGVADQQYVTVTVSSVSTADGRTGGSGSIRVGFLSGDVNQNRVVTLADLGLVNAQVAQFVTASNYLKDVNASGTLSLADKGMTNARLTTLLPVPSAPANQPPQVSAGADQTILFPASANLGGTASDDGLPNPPAALALTWSKAAGPGTVSFADSSAATTTATFGIAGNYVLRLTATDGALTNSADVAIVVDSDVPLGPKLADGIPGVLELVVFDPVKLPRIDGLGFDRFGNLFGVLEVVSAAGGVVTIDKATGGVLPIALGIPGACRLDVHPNGDVYVSSELPIYLGIQFGGLYRTAITYDATNKPVSGVATKLATVLDGPEGIQPLREDSAYGSAGMMFIAEDDYGGRIVRVMPDGSGLVEWVPASANLEKPEGLAFGDFNGAQSPALYAALKAGGRILRIGSDGSLSTLGDPSGVGGIDGPDNINFGPDGYLYVGEKYGGRIIRIAGDGTHSVYATGFDNIEGVAFDPTTGDLYIAEIEKSRVWRVRH